MKIIQVMPMGELPERDRTILMPHGLIRIVGCALVEMEDGQRRIFPVVFKDGRPGELAIMAHRFLFWNGDTAEGYSL